ACTTPPSPLAGPVDITMRYASKASYSGTWALKLQADTTDTITGNGVPAGPWNTQTCQQVAANTNGCPAGGCTADYRWFGDETTGQPMTGLICKQVNVAASDVEAADTSISQPSAFVQSSTGLKIGPMDTTGTNITRSFTGANAVDGTGLGFAKPIVVPFGFFANTCVVQNKCYGDTTSGAANANSKLCLTDSDCNASNGGHCAPTSDGSAPAIGNAANNTIDNITREQAVAIFSGGAKNWTDFGDYFADQAIVACFRHAGSGTHASLDLEILHKAWGATAPTLQKKPASNMQYGFYPYAPCVPGAGGTCTNGPSGSLTANSMANVIWFNDGTSDELNCIAGKSVQQAWTGNVTGGNPNGSCIGAIGYVDADKACPGGTAANVVPIKYMGNLPSREAIRNGRYEFFTNEWMYWNPANANVAAIAGGMDSFASTPSGLATALASNACRATYWASRAEMAFNRGTTPAFPGKVTPSIHLTP
ncbi:MAG TPA: substrate-binding domain-containing protein, partial [Geobacteraceae bacterium]